MRGVVARRRARVCRLNRKQQRAKQCRQTKEQETRRIHWSGFQAETPSELPPPRRKFKDIKRLHQAEPIARMQRQLTEDQFGKPC